MAAFDNVCARKQPNYIGYTGPHPPFTKEEYDALDCWVDKSQAPSWAEISAEIELEQCHIDRIREYPWWTVQLAKIYDDGIDKWKTEMVDPVKAKWPKDNSGPIE